MGKSKFELFRHSQSVCSRPWTKLLPIDLLNNQSDSFPLEHSYLFIKTINLSSAKNKTVFRFLMEPDLNINSILLNSHPGIITKKI